MRSKRSTELRIDVNRARMAKFLFRPVASRISSEVTAKVTAHLAGRALQFVRDHDEVTE